MKANRVNSLILKAVILKLVSLESAFIMEMSLRGTDYLTTE